MCIRDRLQYRLFEKTLSVDYSKTVESVTFTNKSSYKYAFPVIFAISKKSRADVSGIDNKITVDALNVYPNPASDILKIQSDTSVQRWTLYSLSGSCIATGSETTIDTSNIPSGTYLLKIQTEGKEFCYPVLIVH